MDREGIYLRAPVWMQHLLISSEGYRIRRTRYGKTFWRLLREYEERAKWDPEAIRRFRDQRLQAFIIHCQQNVPYYRNLFSELGLSAEDMRTLDDLKALPVLDKNIVQTRYEEFLAENIPAAQRIIAHTSGTTGGGLRFATTAQALCEQWAVCWRYRRTHGLDRNIWCGYFGGRSVVPLAQQKPPFWRVNHPEKQILFSGYHMNDANMPYYIDELLKRRPPWVHGYPSLLALLAAYMLDHDISLDYQVSWITIGAESLLEQQSNLIHHAFGVKPRQHYGLAEAVANISEDPDGVLRVDEDFAAVEFMPNPDGPGHKIIGTNISNPATPLLRYDTTDLAELPSDGQNKTDRGRNVLRLDGRQEDYVVLSNGAKIGRMDHIFKDLVRITEAQILQQAPGRITVRVVCGQGYGDSDEAQLLKEFQKRVGDLAEIKIEYVPVIPRSPTGKLRFVVSEATGGKIGAPDKKGRDRCC